MVVRVELSVALFLYQASLSVIHFIDLRKSSQTELLLPDAMVGLETLEAWTNLQDMIRIYVIAITPQGREFDLISHTLGQSLLYMCYVLALVRTVPVPVQLPVAAEPEPNQKEGHACWSYRMYEGLYGHI